MKPLPVTTLRNNLGTWAVQIEQLPTVAGAMLAALPREPFDTEFRGQHLHTTYFDTADFNLRKARLSKDKYLTLRLRCYRQDGEDRQEYALSAKTEAAKVRLPIEPDQAKFLLAGQGITESLLRLLPADLQARLIALTAERPLHPVVCVHARRYAVENEQDRLTLDVGVGTDIGKRLAFNVLEFKSTQKDDPLPDSLTQLGLRPIKMSKFLWATNTET